MTEYVGKTMIVDTRVADGGVTFEKDCFIWKARHDTNLQNRIVVNYKDIKEIKVDRSSIISETPFGSWSIIERKVSLSAFS